MREAVEVFRKVYDLRADLALFVFLQILESCMVSGMCCRNSISFGWTAIEDIICLTIKYIASVECIKAASLRRCSTNRDKKIRFQICSGQMTMIVVRATAYFYFWKHLMTIIQLWYA